MKEKKGIVRIVVMNSSIKMQKCEFSFSRTARTCGCVRRWRPWRQWRWRRSDFACSEPPPPRSSPNETCPEKSLKWPKGFVNNDVSLYEGEWSKWFYDNSFSAVFLKSVIYWCTWTFLTVLSGSRAMSGTEASTMSENKLRMRLA